MRRHRYLPTGALALVAVAVVVAAGSGCGPIEYLNQVGSRAASAVASAKRAQAERYAPFEYTAAEAYLHKAREEAGYSQYESSINYGRRAEDLANRARAIAIASAAQEPAAAPASPAGAPAEPAAGPGGGRPSSSLPEGVDDEEPGRAAKPPAKPGTGTPGPPGTGPSRKRPGTE